ncbi:hypothetical protein A9P82_07255 [Arachidicoccus ginsenosidimutans]|uniref:tyrosine-type recombinase/integrase n=1 Tax=Arachidicoccus sp. BS20 TaxID=1850526 RepID=UPI0007F0A17E|nr:tyrosine-type recombinase/integrase [Arachidicoccus sp. BS20]ANI89104.1 hypothetical protein A9P82_07255 [Arachidicoccus sp. BS20]
MVFNIISKEDDADTQISKINQFIKVTNKWMNAIAKELGIDFNVTTYVARHSFATILVTEGNAPLEFVGQSFGHANISTTQNYFSGFDKKKQVEFNKALLDFSSLS